MPSYNHILFSISVPNLQVIQRYRGLTLEIRLLLKFLHHLKIIVWETTESKPNNKFIDRHIHKYLKNAALVLTPSKTIRDNFKNTFNYNKPIEILPFWVDWIKEPVLTKTLNKKLLYFGRMDKDKGLDTLIIAFNSLNNPEIGLNICGRGNTNYLNDLLKNSTNIKLHGWVSNETLIQFIKESDYIILPSLHEGYPLSLIEACGYGKPIIATKVGSIPEVFENTQAAFLFEPNCVEDLAEILNRCYKESAKEYFERALAARRLYEQVNNQHNLQLFFSKTLNQFIVY